MDKTSMHRVRAEDQCRVGNSQYVSIKSLLRRVKRLRGGPVSAGPATLPGVQRRFEFLVK